MTHSTPDAPADGRGSPRVIIVATILWGLVGLGSLVPAATSVMLFDAPGSTQVAAVWTVFGVLVTLPLSCAATVVAAWVLYSLRRRPLALRCLWLPVVHLAAIGAAFGWLAARGGSLTP